MVKLRGVAQLLLRMFNQLMNNLMTLSTWKLYLPSRGSPTVSYFSYNKIFCCVFGLFFGV